MGITEVGVGDEDGRGGPIGGREAAELGVVVACAEIVEAGFGVALFTSEFVSVAGGGRVGAFATAGVESASSRMLPEASVTTRELPRRSAK